MSQAPAFELERLLGSDDNGIERNIRKLQEIENDKFG